MPSIIHFEVAVDKPERAAKFYSQVFKWKVEKWAGPMDYWMVTTGPDSEPGINGAFMTRANAPAATVNTIGVPSVDEFAARVVKNGDKIVAPKMAIPGMGYFAYCQDTEGNTFGIYQDDKSAK